jgi:hypothetical protein
VHLNLQDNRENQRKQEITIFALNSIEQKKMGNQITALAPSQILPVDNYFLPEYEFRYDSR